MWHYAKITRCVLHWQGQEWLTGLAHRFINCVLIEIFFHSDHDKTTKGKGCAGHCRGDGSACVSQLSSSGWCCSNSRTWVKGKWPRLPLHSPSHWPLTLILVTFTMSPTCQMKRKKKHIYAININWRNWWILISFKCRLKSHLFSLAFIFLASYNCNNSSF